MSLRRSLAALVPVVSLAACVPEPASAVEIRQTVVEVVDQGRAMALEQTLVDLSTNLDPAPAPAKMAARLLELAAAAVPCAELTRSGDTGVHIDFGTVMDGCSYAGHSFAGVVRVNFSEPTPGARLATIAVTHFVDLTAGTALSGATQVTWGVDETRRVVSEVRLESPDERQIEIQSDRIQRTHRGALQIDGWHRWQTLMGDWRMELAGWELERGALVPNRGLALIQTPYAHEITVDFTGPQAEGLQLRANGGRVDRVYTVAADGEVVDLGDD